MSNSEHSSVRLQLFNKIKTETACTTMCISRRQMLCVWFVCWNDIVKNFAFWFMHAYRWVFFFLVFWCQYVDTFTSFRTIHFYWSIVFMWLCESVSVRLPSACKFDFIHWIWAEKSIDMHRNDATLCSRCYCNGFRWWWNFNALKWYQRTHTTKIWDDLLWRMFYTLNQSVPPLIYCAHVFGPIKLGQFKEIGNCTKKYFHAFQ